MRTNTYIIRRLQEACARRDNARIDGISYVPAGTYGTDFLLYLYSHRKLPTNEIRQGIKSATSAEYVELDISDSDIPTILATVVEPQNMPSQIYLPLSIKLPFALCDTDFKIPFKSSIIGIEHADLTIGVYLQDRTREIWSSKQDSRTKKMSKRWEDLLDHLNITTE